MRRDARRSVWHARSLAGQRSRPRSCPQWLWFWETPVRTNKAYWCKRRANGWQGGRDRDKPRKSAWHYYARGEWLGGVLQYSLDDQYLAYVCKPAGDIAKRFGRRFKAKRWVEVESARRRQR
jgi:hypothetical protein